MKRIYLLAVLVVLLGTLSSGQQPVVNDSKKKTHGNVAQASQQNTVPSAATPSAFPAQSQTNPRKENNGAPPNDQVYKVNVVSQPRDPVFVLYVVLTGFAVIAGVITAIAVWRQMKANEKTAEAARTSAQSVMVAERAWMIGSPEFNNFTRAPAADEYVVYLASYKNVGKSPAILLEAGVSLKMVRRLENLPETPTYVPAEIVRFERLLLVPDDSFALSSQQLQMTTDEYSALYNRENFLVAHGFVRYEDIFAQRHETTFCHYYRVPWPNELIAEGFSRYVNAPPEYNKAT
jgi:hypothetical protein